MKAHFQSDRNEGSLLNIIFKASEQEKAEAMGNHLVSDYGYEWITGEDDMYTLGAPHGETIAEMRNDWQAAKESFKKLVA